MTRSSRPAVTTIVHRIRSALAGLPGIADDRLDTADAADDGDPAATDERRALEAEAEHARYNPDAADFEVVTAALDSDDPALRKLGTEVIAGTPATSRGEVVDAVPSLVRRLEDDELSVRQYAAKALANIAPADPAGIRDEASALVDHVSDHNLRISANVAAALAEAADSYPDEIAPLHFEYVDGDVRNTPRQNALLVLERAARTSPESVEPVVPEMVRLIDRRVVDRTRLLRTAAAVADEYPDLFAPVVPALVSYVENYGGEDGEAAIEALARLALADPGLARSAVSALAKHLAETDPPHADLAAAALVRIVDSHPDERQRVLEAFGEVDEMDRLSAARRLVDVSDETGVEIATAALEGSSLHRYVDR